MPQAMKPTGTSRRFTSSSPSAGMKLPPRPLAPGCGSFAICHDWPSKLDTRRVCVVCFSSPWFAELDCPATTKTSPTPTCSTVDWATTSPSCSAWISKWCHPPAGAVTEAEKVSRSISTFSGCQSAFAPIFACQITFATSRPFCVPRMVRVPSVRELRWTTWKSSGAESPISAAGRLRAKRWQAMTWRSFMASSSREVLLRSACRSRPALRCRSEPGRRCASSNRAHRRRPCAALISAARAGCRSSP